MGKAFYLWKGPLCPTHTWKCIRWEEGEDCPPPVHAPPVGPTRDKSVQTITDTDLFQQTGGAWHQYVLLKVQVGQVCKIIAYCT